MVQIEVTTKCNLTCFYCVGRKMTQSDIDMDTFIKALERVPLHSAVHLQGEGEPLMHPQIHKMIEMCRSHGHTVSTTTNGTIPFDISLVDSLHVSVDTLDPTVNAGSGRAHFDKTMSNLRMWIATAPAKLVIRTTAFGQNIGSIVAFCKANKLTHFIQQLNQKEDYSKCYEVKPLHFVTESVPSCSWVNRRNQYFTVDGLELPCCFIKFPKETYEEIIVAFNEGTVPLSCTGCRQLTFNRTQA